METYCVLCNALINRPRKQQRFCNATCRKEYSVKQAKETFLGRTFGKWNVIELVSMGKESLWSCKCECGLVKVHKLSTLQSGNTTQCRSCAQKNRDEFPFFIYARIKEGAIRRKIKFDVSQDYLYNLFSQQRKECALTGWPLTFAKSVKKHSHRGTTASLDRVDSSLGYVEGNVQWVHKHINWMKRDHDDLYFRSICEAVASHCKGKDACHARGSELFAFR